MIENLGGRKFVGFMSICFLFTVLVALGKLSPEQLTGFVTANFGLYVIGNSIEKAMR